MTNKATTILDEAMVENLVRSFYTKVRADPTLGPIFARRIGDDWEPHMQTMFNFWSAMMLKTGRYDGRPMPKHIALKEVQPAHFDIWLALFEETALDIAGDSYGLVFVEKARRVAQSFKSVMFFDPAALDPNRKKN